MTQHIATLAGGCFWCLEAVFQRIEGVAQARSGYMGGHVDQPTYKQVCQGNTGHAEVVQIEFYQAVIGYSDLLEVFFAIHDPTTLNQQGNDIGPQYRSAVYFHDTGQKHMAEVAISALTASDAFRARIVTEITAASTFWPAEGYHQGYFDANPHQPYCMAVVSPKVRKAMQKFGARMK